MGVGMTGDKLELKLTEIKSDVKNLTKDIQKLIELNERSIRHSEKITELRKDVDQAHSHIREIQQKENKCGIHEQRILANESRLKVLEGRGWQVLLAFMTGASALVLGLLKGR